MNALNKELLSYKELFKRFGKSQKVYDKGLDIFLDYGPNNNLRRLLKKGQLAPRTKHWNHLEHQLKRLGLDTVKAEKQVAAAPIERKKIQSASIKAPIQVTLEAADVLSDDLEVLIAKNRKLAQDRALLTNQLRKVPIDGNAKLIEKNQNIVEQILHIIAEQEPIEAKIGEMKANQGKKEPEENPIIFEGKDRTYRINDLYEMSINDLGTLRLKLNKTRLNFEKRMPGYKTQKSVLIGQKTISKCKHAMNVIDRVLADLRIAQNG